MTSEKYHSWSNLIHRRPRRIEDAKGLMGPERQPRSLFLPWLRSCCGSVGRSFRLFGERGWKRRNSWAAAAKRGVFREMNMFLPWFLEGWYIRISPFGCFEISNETFFLAGLFKLREVLLHVKRVALSTCIPDLHLVGSSASSRKIGHAMRGKSTAESNSDGVEQIHTCSNWYTTTHIHNTNHCLQIEL